MELLNLGFGIVGIVSFMFSIFVYMKSEKLRKTELEKNNSHKVRLQTMRSAMTDLLATIDALVQMPKSGTISIAQMQNVARVARAQGFRIAENINDEILLSNAWKFGKNPNTDTLNRLSSSTQNSAKETGLGG